MVSPIQITFTKKIGKSTHELIAEAVAEMFNSYVFDEAFEKAKEIGELLGQEAYEIAINKILGTTGVDNAWAQKILSESVYHPTQSDVAIRLMPIGVFNPKKLIV